MVKNTPFPGEKVILWSFSSKSSKSSREIPIPFRFRVTFQLALFGLGQGMASLIPRSSSYPLPLGPAAQLGAGRFDTTVLQGAGKQTFVLDFLQQKMKLSSRNSSFSRYSYNLNLIFCKKYALLPRNLTVSAGDLRISRGAAPLNELRIFKRSVKRDGCSNWHDKLWNKENEVSCKIWELPTSLEHFCPNSKLHDWTKHIKVLKILFDCLKQLCVKYGSL